MFLRFLMLLVALCSSLTPNLNAGTARGNRLISEGGGAVGIPGVAGPAGAPGIAGAAGVPGVPGIPSAPGILDFSDFFALMPGDNSATVATGAPVLFPQIGSTTGVIIPDGTILPVGSAFILPIVGTYLVEFQVSVDEAGQLMLNVNGIPDQNTVVGRDTGTSQIVGVSLLTTTTPNTVLEVINPPNNTTALTITPADGSLTHPFSAHLTITRIR